MNSRPSYFKSDTNVSFKIYSPSMVKAVIYVAVFPSISSVLNATITVSSVPGTKRKLENPLLGELCDNGVTLISCKLSSPLMITAHPIISSRVSLYLFLLHFRGRKNQRWCTSDQTPLSWIIYPGQWISIPARIRLYSSTQLTWSTWKVFANLCFGSKFLWKSLVVDQSRVKKNNYSSVKFQS